MASNQIEMASTLLALKPEHQVGGIFGHSLKSTSKHAKTLLVLKVTCCDLCCGHTPNVGNLTRVYSIQGLLNVSLSSKLMWIV